MLLLLLLFSPTSLSLSLSLSLFLSYSLFSSPLVFSLLLPSRSFPFLPGSYADRCATGDTRVTLGFRLHATHVLHSVGPIGVKPAVLASTYTTALDGATAIGARSVALCHGSGKSLRKLVRAGLGGDHQLPQRFHFRLTRRIAADAAASLRTWRRASVTLVVDAVESTGKEDVEGARGAYTVL